MSCLWFFESSGNARLLRRSIPRIILQGALALSILETQAELPPTWTLVEDCSQVLLNAKRLTSDVCNAKNATLIENEGVELPGILRDRELVRNHEAHAGRVECIDPCAWWKSLWSTVACHRLKSDGGKRIGHRIAGGRGSETCRLVVSELQWAEVVSSVL